MPSGIWMPGIREFSDHEESPAASQTTDLADIKKREKTNEESKSSANRVNRIVNNLQNAPYSIARRMRGEIDT